MRICFVTNEFVTEPSNFDGGLANYLFRISICLKQFQHEPIILIASDKDEIIFFRDIEIHRVNAMNQACEDLSQPIQWLFQSLILNKYIKEHLAGRNIDIIQYTGHFAMGFFRVKTIPSVARISGYRPLLDKYYYNPKTTLNELRMKLEIDALKIMDGIFAPSTFVSNLIKRDEGLNVEVIESPFIYDVSSLDATVYEKYLKGKKYLLFFGTIGTLKGVHVIAEMIGELLGKYTQLFFVFIGKDNGYGRQSMIDFVLQKAGWFQDRIIRFDKMPHSQLYPIIQNCFAVVLPSLTDNFPNTCLESMAHKKIVLGTKETGFDQIIRNGINGFLCKKDSPADLLDSLVRILNLPEGEKNIIEENAFKQSLSYSAEQIIPGLITFYNNAIKNYDLSEVIRKTENYDFRFRELVLEYLNETRKEILSKDDFIQTIFKSYKYRTGDFLLKPLILGKKIYSFIKNRIFIVLKLIKIYIIFHHFQNRHRTTRLFFFFPSATIGGAEKVHIDILSCIQDYNPVVFLTSGDLKNDLYPFFREYASVYDISGYMDNLFLKETLTNYLLKVLNSLSDITIFGCNSDYFYEILPSFNKNIYVIDLLHAFSKPDEGFEDISLPYVDRFNKRVVINNKTKSDFKEKYLENHIPARYLEKIVVIPNQVEIPENYSIKDKISPLKVLYIGRATQEKRVHLVGKIAAYCSKEGVMAEFILVGDQIEKAVDVNFRKYCTFKKAITDPQRLYELYRESNIILIVSSREGFPLVVMEAMANGVVPVCTNVGGISEHIQNEANGLLIEPLEEEHIVENFTKIIKQLSEDREKLNRISYNAYLYAKDHFNREPFCASYRNLFHNKN
jgi:glycosyltransferase involved in cell wall biosynthesis